MKSTLEVRAVASGELSKEYGRSLLKMADIERRSDTPSARQSYMKALELRGNQPESAQAMIRLALMEMAGKSFGEAERMLVRAIESDPKAGAPANMWLGVLREKQGRLEDAANVLELHARLLGSQSKSDEAGNQGTVTLAVELGVDGTAQNLSVVRGLGLELSEKALEAVRKWKFRPGTKGGESVPVMATIEVNFRLL